MVGVDAVKNSGHELKPREKGRWMVVKRLDCTTSSHEEERTNKDVVWLKDP
mgnify:CR=1 FL=1